MKSFNIDAEEIVSSGNMQLTGNLSVAGKASMEGKLLSTQEDLNLEISRSTEEQAKLSDKISIVENIAKGASGAVSFDNYSEMVAALNSLSADTYTKGQNIMIVTLQVPDLWVSYIEDSATVYEYTSDNAIIEALAETGYIQVGFFKLSQLETQKVNLETYAKKSDLDLYAKHTDITKITSVTESSSDGGSNIVTFSDGNMMTIKNGSQGQPGAKGHSIYVSGIRQNPDGSGYKLTSYSGTPSIATNDLIIDKATSKLYKVTGSVAADEFSLEDMGMTLRGEKGADGKDYVMTEADKAEIVQMVIESLGGNPIFGYVDENNNIILSGTIVNGIYSVKYEMEDGSTVDIGNLVLEDEPSEPEEPEIINLFNAETATYNARLSTSDGSVKTGVNGAVVTDFIDITNFDTIKISGTFVNNATARYGALRFYTAENSYISEAGVLFDFDPNNWQLALQPNKDKYPTFAKIRICLAITESTAITAADTTDIVISYS